VRRDVQNIYRGLPEHLAVRTAAQMSTNMDPRAPYKLTEEQRALVHKHPHIVRLKELKSIPKSSLKTMGEYSMEEERNSTSNIGACILIS